MRIKNLDDLNKLGNNAKRQVESILKQQGGFRVSERAVPEIKKIPRIRQDVKNATRVKKAKPAKVMKTHEGLSYCPYPNPDPSVTLHIALLKVFGSWWTGGEMADEMIIPGHSIKFRYDFCFPRYRVAIEIDGFGYHRDLKSFKKDREKQKHALKNGWVVHRLTNSDLRNAFHDIIPDIKTILAHREKHSATLVPVGKVWCELAP